MNDQRVSREILKRAAEAAGGEQALAKMLGRDVQEVQEWLLGKRIIPINVYLEACRIVLGDLKDRN